MSLQLLDLNSGMFNKGKQEWWQYIEEKHVPMLLQAVIDAKGEDYAQCLLAMIDVDLASLIKAKQDLKNSSDTINQEIITVTIKSHLDSLLEYSIW